MIQSSKHITVTPEFWAQPGTVSYTYVAPDGALWNVGRVEANTVHLWTIDAWGRTQYCAANIFEFRATWAERA